jgi:hypothetical protein
MTDIAGQIMGSAEAFARTCTGLGYDTSNVRRGLMSEFSLTPAEADAVIAKVTGITIKED